MAKKFNRNRPDKPVETDDFLDSFSAEDLEFFREPEKPLPVTSVDRLERAFQEIVEFRRLHGRLPSAETREIAERKLGARLAGILASHRKLEALRPLDTEFGLLTPTESFETFDELLESDCLSDLVSDDDADIFDVSTLPEVATRNSQPGDIERRKKCPDFETFAPLFKRMHEQLADGSMRLVPESSITAIVPGAYLVVGGVMVFIAEVKEPEYKVMNGKEVKRERMRVIFENGTESAMYRQSLAVRLGLQEGKRAVPSVLDSLLVGDDDVLTGNIYVLRSLSEKTEITSIPNLYKVGFSRGSVEKRIANAKREPTYLMAPVEVVATYQTYNLKTSALEHLLHRVFAMVKLDVTIIGLDGKAHHPSEWFSVPFPVLDQAIEAIIDGSIVNLSYDPEDQKLIERDSA
ncbi:GIY-YIG nuclease family protein [Corynebacterium aquilae]|uniref:GIY-YIG nuclease family protein n=1 Tax=Corynebacterium aquilae TaxID=203263 RepID=UPI0009526EBE|nr:GIY-YIG nuclease family protein [Corynebacterium aquilae]